ncbi:hypothetical protein TspCOW1_31580 [Thiohalobacter sp. COW1]|uniref:M23 family metallopeptidase n=1 Tax=Thiohalobacter sp. COW1 TaxID=2795687 RepID=UPI001915BABE|nr:M23 family metallopeptidase [Thiohalobacter sp. COW1]BCO33055.1 hypothetical protein TspCOW1_31580 [Thiohalobacter sp. COW1]
MNIILFTNLHGRPGSLNLSRPRIYVPLLSLGLFLAASLFYLGFQLGQVQDGPGLAAGPQWRLEVAEQQRAVAQARQESQAHLDALAMRLGQLQGQVLRLEGLGQRLVEMADIDQGEFDFEQIPPQGGPAAEAAAGYAVPDFIEELDTLSRVLDDREQQLLALESVVRTRTLKQQGVPTGRPVTSGWMSSAYGKRTDPFTGKQAWHDGVDFAGKAGTEVVAVAAGVVTWSGSRYGYGNLVEINHGNGYVTRYGHNRDLVVEVGQHVKPGQAIARMGSSGRSTGPHVHFEVLKHGKSVDPARFVWAKRS